MWLLDWSNLLLEVSTNMVFVVTMITILVLIAMFMAFANSYGSKDCCENKPPSEVSSEEEKELETMDSPFGYGPYRTSENPSTTVETVPVVEVTKEKFDGQTVIPFHDISDVSCPKCGHHWVYNPTFCECKFANSESFEGGHFHLRCVDRDDDNAGCKARFAMKAKDEFDE